MKKKTDPAEILRANIIRLRGSRGWTQRELAERAGLSTVAMIESGARGSKPSHETVRKIAAAFGMEVDELYDDPSEPQPPMPAELRAFLVGAGDVEPEEVDFLRKLVKRGFVSGPTVRTYGYALDMIRSGRTPAKTKGSDQ